MLAAARAPVRFRLVHSSDLIEMAPGGALDVARARALLLALAAANAEAGLDLLLDLRDAHDAGISFGEVYRLLDVLHEHRAAFRGRVALLDSMRPGFEKVQFFEATATEAGFAVRAFLDFEAAVRWLQATSPLPEPPPAPPLPG